MSATTGSQRSTYAERSGDHLRRADLQKPTFAVGNVWFIYKLTQMQGIRPVLFAWGKGYSDSVETLSGSLAMVWIKEGLIQCQRVL